ncbi:MAG: NfeD family protein [Acidobacteriota bacterium]|nr:MAG: NfeD family protein [Acidobacteriota bacterium]
MSELAGLAFFVLLAAGALFGLRSLAKKRTRTESEFEKGVEESASLVGAGVKALQGILDPGERKGKEAITELRQGRYKKRSGADEDADRTRGPGSENSLDN